MHLTTNKGFNPRLPLLGGDAAPISFLLRRNTVSIHASRCWEAMPDKTMRVADNHEVSIHASRCWEAMHLSPVQSVVVVPVSIHASRCWEAMLFVSDWFRCGGRCFNPRLPLLGGDAYFEHT